MSKFNLGDALADVLGDVSKKDTEEIVSISLDQISGDTRNFYNLTGIEELADNIALCGLMDPIRVWWSPGDEYTVVSGHRRLAAVTTLGWKTVPCIVEKQEKDRDMQELRLIMANASTRQLSDAEIGHQSERLRVLLSNLREQGMELPGRLRDIAADIMQVSASKLARLDKINKSLCAQLRPSWDGGKLKESAAYRMAQEDNAVQRAVCFCYGSKAIEDMTADDLEKAIFRAKQPPEKKTPGPETKKAEIDFGTLDKAIEAAKGQNAGVAEFLADEYSERLKQEKAIVRKALDNGLAEHFIGGYSWMEANNRTDAYKELGFQFKRSGRFGHDANYDFADGRFGIGLSGMDRKDFASLSASELFDELALWALRYCSEKLAEDDDGEENAVTSPKWKTGRPPISGKYYCKFNCDGTIICTKALYERYIDAWYMGKEKAEAEVVGWWPLPD